MRYLGYPYTATGNSPSTGFSCIGFVSFVYRSNGIPLPGDLGGALAFAPQVPFSALQPGDILYFQNTVWNGLSHAAIYIGGGKFIHAEWYNRGVVISSFNNDPTDGNYWIGKYLGANRPWYGASVGAVVNTGVAPKAPTTPTTPQSTAVKSIASGPTAVVNTSSLNVRSGPSKTNSVLTTVQQGAPLVILAKSNGWYKVQLPDGTVGWVMAPFVSRSGQVTSTASTTPANIGNPVSPRQVRTATRVRSHAVATIHVSSLRIRSGPSTSSAIVSAAYKGQKVQVLARSNGWLKVLLPDGTVGWMKASFTSARSQGASQISSTAQPNNSVTRTTTANHVFHSGSVVKSSTNVRSSPSLTSGIVTVLPPGGAYRVLGWSNGWAHVQLAGGVVGWISGTVLGTAVHASQSKTYQSTRRSGASILPGSGSYVLTAGVRVHTRPGVSAPVVTLAAAGTHVNVLGYRNGWDLIRLPAGSTGYVLGSFVRSK
ncbi:MAG TPA: SH3 domain-containing protein [Chloroflexota bacterium]